MAFNRFTKNVLNVSGLPDRVQNQAQALKATFDQAGVDIKQALNGLISELEAATSASNLGADVSSVTTKTVQAILTAFELEIANRYTKNEIDTLVSGNTNDLVADVDVNLTTGVITITKKDGAVEKFDTALEKVPAKFEIVESGTSLFLKITNVDGTSTQTNITDLMNIYDFNNTNDIAFNVSGTGNEKVVTASIRPNSIGLDKLSLSVMTTLEGYMTSARDSASAAKISETNARNSANTATRAAEKASIAESLANTAINKATEAESYAHGGTGTREGEDTDNAKYYSQVAKEVAGGDFVTPTEMEAYAQKKGTVPSFEGEELSGEVIEVDSLLAIESKLKISGNSEQDSRSGKNMFDEISLLGAYLTDGYYNFGISTLRDILNPKIKEIGGFKTNTQYTISFTGYFTTGVWTKFTFYYTDGTSNSKFFSEKTEANFIFVSSVGKTIDHIELISDYWAEGKVVFIKENTLQLEEGSVATEYEPHGAQPSPDYPSEIRSVKSKSDNLLRFPYTDDTTKTKNGITFTANDDGSVTINGTATANATYYMWYKSSEKFKLKGKFTLNSQKTPNGDEVFRGAYLKDDGTEAYLNGGNSYNFETEKAVDLYLVILSGQTVNNLTVYPMLNKGDKALPYQPYGYVPVEAKVEGKNLFDKNNAPLIRGYTSGSTMTIVADTSVRMSYIKCKPNTTYTAQKISGYLFTLSYSDVEPAIGTRFIERKIANTGTTVSITTNDKAKYLIIEYYKNDAELQPILDSIQIEEGTTATPYEPYKTKTLSLPLGDIQLRSIPDGTRDTFERVDGVWNKVEKIMPFTITEDMVTGVNLEYYGIPHGAVTRPEGAIITYKADICLMTSYKQKVDNRHGVFTTGGSNSKIQFLNENITDLATAKTILVGETGIIKRATPTYTPITDPVLIQALDELEQIILHKGYNRITVTSVNGVKAYLDLSIPPTASVTNVVEIDSELDMPIPVVSNTGDVKVKIPAKNQMTLNPFTGEVNVKGLKINGKNVTAGSKLLFEHTLTSEEDSLVLENLNLLLDNLEKAYIFICARKAGNAVTSYRLNDNVLYNNKGEEDTYMLIECLRVGDKMFITTSPVTTNLTDTALKSPIVITSESIDKISINPADTDNYDHKLYAGTTVVIFK